MILTIKPKVQANALNTTILIKSKNPKLSNRAAYRIIKPGIDVPEPTPVKFEWITGGTAGTISSDGLTYTCSQTNPNTGSEFWFTYGGQLSDLTVSNPQFLSIASTGTDNTFKVVYNTAFPGEAGNSTSRIRVTDGTNYLNLYIPINIATTNSIEITAGNLDVLPNGTEQADLYIFQGTKPATESELEVLRSNTQTVRRTYAEDTIKTIDFPAYINGYGIDGTGGYGRVLVNGLQSDSPYTIWMVTRKTGKEEQFLHKEYNSSLPATIYFETGSGGGSGGGGPITPETRSTDEENPEDDTATVLSDEESMNDEEVINTVEETDNGTEESAVD